MEALQDLVDNAHTMVVTTSLCANPADRKLERVDVAPVQVLDSDGFSPIEWLRDMGVLGMSALAVVDDERLLIVDGDIIYVAHTCGRIDTLPGSYSDLHEVDVYDDEILAANTGNDEVIIFDRDTLVERHRVRPSAASAASDEGVDRFHLNQGLRLPDGTLVALVHHVDGRQLVQRMKAKVLKSHGNGGVVGLDGAPNVELNLAAPHNIRVLSDGFMVLDSQRSLGRRYDRNWQQQLEFETAGWGRGCVVDEANDLVFIGSSPPRLRYRKQLQSRYTDRSIVEARRISDGSLVASAYVPNCEQINNLYLFDADVYRRHFQR